MKDYDWDRDNNFTAGNYISPLDGTKMDDDGYYSVLVFFILWLGESNKCGNKNEDSKQRILLWWLWIAWIRASLRWKKNIRFL